MSDGGVRLRNSMRGCAVLALTLSMTGGEVASAPSVEVDQLADWSHPAGPEPVTETRLIEAVTGSGEFVALTPARLLETRPGSGLTTIDGKFLAGGALGPATTLNLTVTGRGNVPTNGVGAVVLNVTGTQPTAPTFITAWPTGQTRPEASNLNLMPGETRPNLVIAKVGANGQVSLYNTTETPTSSPTHLAEDLAHDAFAALFEKWDDLDDASKAPAYLRTTVTNKAMSSHRRQATARKHAATQATHERPGTSASAESIALATSGRPDIVAALQELSPKQRSAVVLKYWLRYTEGEIADTIGCSVGSARTHLHRGHHALAALLGDHDERR